MLIINGDNYEKRRQLHKEMEQAKQEIKEQTKDVDRYRERKGNMSKDPKYNQRNDT